MRDLGPILRKELERLEAELAADPRTKKAQKIRELLEIYSSPHPIPAADRSDTKLGRYLALEATKAKQPRFKRLRSILGLKQPEGTAAVARSRLIAISQSNHWTNASPAWLQLPKDAMGRSLSYDHGLSPTMASAIVQVSPERPEAQRRSVLDSDAKVLSLR
jgi:hypothetical protein